ncbi:RTA1 like protein-domain-containing protein [Mycena maculata]|uniref:RTA1 like protein-domain-containing protein n=1 Tax=Mycena maculata TaxID=230809 RepID=A0AAD7J263_9AGAR|nr:RTA1 like protein-domain-containing protein [Mycena maculata]
MTFFTAILQLREVFNPYHYVPTEWICVSFVALFAISTVLHLAQAIRYRVWWLLPTAFVSGILEVVGWSARLWSSFSPDKLLPFEIQVIGTIIGPTPLIAADFMILARIIHRLGTRYSRLSPKWYSIIFCSCDIISLSVQGFGGTVASLAVGKSKSPDHGAHIMLAGIIFQMVTISIYIMLASEFFLRYFTDKAVGGKQAAYHTLNTHNKRGRGQIDRRLRIMIGALAFNTTCLLIRAIYRTLELLNGFEGRIISTQRYFNILDGGMIALAIFTLNIAHPGIYLAPQDREDSEVELRLKEAGLLYYRL